MKNSILGGLFTPLHEKTRKEIIADYIENHKVTSLLDDESILLITKDEHRERSEFIKEFGSLSTTRLLFTIVIKALVKQFLQERNYYSTLILKHKQLIYRDEYGDYIYTDWFNELRRFANNKNGEIRYFVIENLSNNSKKVLKKLCKTDYDCFPNHIEDSGMELVEYISDMVSDEVFNNQNTCCDDDIDNITNPYEYESAVAGYISTELNWDSYVTKGSGDQGADVVAEKNGVKLIIQCKLYSQDVGNKAVQEAIAARQFYDANFAAVVTNQGYTKSAMQLAQSAQVILLHHSQLDLIDQLVDDIS